MNRLKSPTKLLREIEIPYITNNFHHEFKGELIENKLYQSADDVVDSHSDHHDTESSVNGSPAEPYYKNLQTKLETEENFTRMRLISKDIAKSGELEPDTTVKMK